LVRRPVTARLGSRARLRFLCCLALGWSVTSAAFAQDAGLLRYEPPDVERVYPAEGESLAPVPTTDPPAAPAPAGAKPAVPTPAPSAAPPLPPAPPAEYGAQAKVRSLPPAPAPGSREVPLDTARDLPGAFGDPLRILDSLPGTVPIASAVPYVYVRGAPPAAVGYVYDNIPLPQLFHGVFGRSVIHPRILGPVTLFAGVPPARYGRRAGGLVLAEGVEPKRKFSSELELGLIDLGAYVETPVGKGTLTMSGHIGYPKLAIAIAESLGIINPGTSFNYYDGQVRYRVPLGARDRFEVLWLGSYDNANLPGLSNDPRAGASRVEFHRVETRLVHRLQRGEIGTALRFGYDYSSLGNALDVKATTFGPRFWTELRLGQHAVRIGGDIYTSVGSVRDGPGSLATPEGDIQVSLPLFSNSPARNQGGVYAQTTLRTSERTHLDLGARFDYWSTAGKLDLAFDPRARFVLNPTEKLELHAAAGMGHQPAVFMLPLPGLTEVAVSQGLASSIQSEVGVGYALPQHLSIQLQGFYHQYDGLLLPELVTDGIVPENPPLVSANAYGGELFLKRELDQRLAGWISYTLAWAEADSGPDVIGKFKPDFDVRHVINTVLQWRIGRGFELGVRFSARSGRLIEQLNPRYSQRLPWFVRTDARIGYRWKGRFANMLAYFEWLNMLVRNEYLDADCLLGTCRAAAAPAISIPNVGIRAEF
jgi:hypothetical protein